MLYCFALKGLPFIFVAGLSWPHKHYHHHLLIHSILLYSLFLKWNQNKYILFKCSTQHIKNERKKEQVMNSTLPVSCYILYWKYSRKKNSLFVYQREWSWKQSNPPLLQCSLSLSFFSLCCSRTFSWKRTSTKELVSWEGSITTYGLVVMHELLM